MSSGDFEQVSSGGKPLAMHKHICKLEWNVYEISKMSLDGDHFSPLASSPDLPDFKWSIGLSVNEAEEDKFISVFLKQDFPPCSMICFFQYKLSVEDSNFKKVSEFNVASDIAPSSASIRTTHLLRFADVTSDLQDDTLVLEAEITFVFLQPDSVQSSAMWFVQAGNGLLADMSLMFGNKAFSDVVIRVDDVTIHAHQVYLAARSPVLRDMLKNMPENEERCIVISDISPDAVRNMLFFISTGKFDDKRGIDEVIELLKCSKQYSLSGLKRLCEVNLIRSVNEENAIKCLVAADLYSAEELKARSIDIICATKRSMSRMKQFMNSDEGDAQQKIRLNTEITHQIMMKYLPD